MPQLFLPKGEAVHPGHRQVQQDETGPQPILQLSQGLLAVRARHGVELGRGRQRHECVA